MKRNAKRAWSNFSEKLNDSLEIPQTAEAHTAQIELIGNREAVVDGCRGILQYEDAVVRIAAGELVVRFTGSDLCICTMQAGQTRITGVIAGVDFT